MVTISVCLIGIYLGSRYIYSIDTNIRIQVEILPSQNTLTQVFITDKRDFFEKGSAYYQTQGGAWQEIELTIPELRVGKIRLDPGDGPGTFRIRSFRVNYPFDAQWYPLSLEEFRPDQGVESAVLVNDELVIKTQPLHTDPFPGLSRRHLSTRHQALVLFLALVCSRIYAAADLLWIAGQARVARLRKTQEQWHDRRLNLC